MRRQCHSDFREGNNPILQSNAAQTLAKAAHLT